MFSLLEQGLFCADMCEYERFSVRLLIGIYTGDTE